MGTLDETLTNYLLPRDLSERERCASRLLFRRSFHHRIDNRLNGQHLYLKKFAYDDRLVYDQDVHIDGGSSVLDSGTGTGECDFLNTSRCFLRRDDSCMAPRPSAGSTPDRGACRSGRLEQ